MPQVHSNKKDLKANYVPTTEFYSQVIDSFQDYTILTVDNDFLINNRNTGSKAIFIYDEKEIRGKHFEIIFTEKDRKKGIPAKEIGKALKEGRTTDKRHLLCKDDSLFYANGLDNYGSHT